MDDRIFTFKERTFLDANGRATTTPGRGTKLIGIPGATVPIDQARAWGLLEGTPAPKKKAASGAVIPPESKRTQVKKTTRKKTAAKKSTRKKTTARKKSS